MLTFGWTQEIDTKCMRLGQFYREQAQALNPFEIWKLVIVGIDRANQPTELNPIHECTRQV